MAGWISRVAFSALFCLLCQNSTAQNSSATPAFDVATIKLTDPAFGGILIRLSGGKFSATGFTLKDLIAFAYSMELSQIVGGPKWLASDRYDILGKPDMDGPLSRSNAKIMLQALLADRFQLRVHPGIKEMPVYVLTVRADGSRMKLRHDGDGGETTRLTFRGPTATGRNVSTKVLAEELAAMVLGRPVVDRTGLTGAFDLNLKWRPETSQVNGASASLSDDPDIFTAIQEQLGLKLEARKAPAEIIIVDNAMKPSEN